ncbi:MAG: Gfo/Idh/MocA family oxidoreductase [Roseobacter sp.]
MINVAVVGVGVGAQHIDAYSALPQYFNVLRVIDKKPDLASALARKVDATASQDIEDALLNPDIHLIDICLPPNLHVEYSLRSLAHGKHVVCEKPIATSLKDADELSAAVHKSGKKLYPVFQYRWGPPLQQLRALIQAGITGQPQLAALETHWSRGADYYDVPWRGTWAGEQGGAVLGHAIHSHDLLCYFFGAVKSLSALTATRANPIETEDCAAITFEMQCGALATSSITLGAAHNETRLKFVFENLTAVSGKTPYAPGAERWVFEARDPTKQHMIDTFLREKRYEHVGFRGLFSEVGKDLMQQPNEAVTIQDGVCSIELVTAIYHAARTGSRVHLPISKNHPLYEGWMP